MQACRERKSARLCHYLKMTEWTNSSLETRGTILFDRLYKIYASSQLSVIDRRVLARQPNL